VTNLDKLDVVEDNGEFDLEEFLKGIIGVKIFATNVIKTKSMYNNTFGMDEIIGYIAARKGRLFVYEHYFTWFNEYFNYYMKTINLLITNEGYIPLTWRYYIAIMSVSTMRCEYLLKSLEENFLDVGGDESWLIHGLDVVPEKLARLGRINNMIAHQPWIILPDDIKEINSNKDQKDSTYWNMNELIQAVLIMCQFQKLATVAESLQIHFCAYLHDKHSQDVGNNSDIKQKLLKNLEMINLEETCEKKGPRKSCDFSEADISDLKHILEEDKSYSKHVNSFCNVYHDFDPHSEEYRSYLVK
jgi:hypothetical protein